MALTDSEAMLSIDELAWRAAPSARTPTGSSLRDRLTFKDWRHCARIVAAIDRRRPLMPDVRQSNASCYRGISPSWGELTKDGAIRKEE